MADETKAPVEPGEGEIDFVINEDGSVTFRRLPPELMDLALALDPDATLACEVPAKADGE